jgi:adenylate kinase family enzyme
MRIHIFGASGSGTTTLGKALANKLNYLHLDSDNYYWTDVGEYKNPRDKKSRTEMLINELKQSNDWVLSGSLCNWSDESIIPYIDLAVFLYIPFALRMQRLKIREQRRLGDRIKIGGDRYSEHIKFLQWASDYETAGLNMRSKQLHEAWIENLPMNCLKIYAQTTDKQIEILFPMILNNKFSRGD